MHVQTVAVMHGFMSANKSWSTALVCPECQAKGQESYQNQRGCELLLAIIGGIIILVGLAIAFANIR
jgi:hypothetical protein